MTNPSALTESAKALIRRKAKQVFAALDQEEKSDSETPSWIGTATLSVCDNANDPTAAAKERTNTCLYFDATGFRHVPSFSSKQECNAMKQQMAQQVAQQWDPTKHSIDSFETNDMQMHKRGDYFLESADKTHFFVEPAALQKDGKSLLAEYMNENDNNNNNNNKKLTALNKAGHALHLEPGAFSEYCLSPKVRDFCLDLGWRDPVVPQGMYIFKQARTGGVVNSHQDSTFLYTTPKQSCLGLWLALHDATLDNGCLWVRPKSHHESVRRQYKRNPAHFGQAAVEARSNLAKGDASEPKFVMDKLYEHDVKWDGDLPENGWKGLLDAGFVPVECKAGDLLAFCGDLDHLSLPNYSDKPRHTFQLHLVEGPGASVTWSPSNWLQYPDKKPFLRLLDDH